jgi:hypothetical protein
MRGVIAAAGAGEIVLRIVLGASSSRTTASEVCIDLSIFIFIFRDSIAPLTGNARTPRALRGGFPAGKSSVTRRMRGHLCRQRFLLTASS